MSSNNAYGNPSPFNGISTSNKNNNKAAPALLPTPFRGVLDVRFEPGQTLTVKGIVGEEARQFSINLHNRTADFSGNDVPLRIVARVDRGKICLNSLVNKIWGKDQRKTYQLKAGQPIDLRIRAHDKEFQIIIDGKEFKKYTYQSPLQSITHLSIDGDLAIQQIHWGGKVYPVPYETGFPHGFPVGKCLKVSGTPSLKKMGRFEVNLLRKSGDIALQLNARFDEKAVVRNSLEANEWGNEEREGKMPFEKGHCFDLAISNEATHFEIFVNGQHFANFAHRSKPDDIFGLLIQGDIEVRIIDKSFNYLFFFFGYILSAKILPKMGVNKNSNVFALTGLEME